MTQRSCVLRTRLAVALLAPLVVACSDPTEAGDPLDPGTGPWAFRASLIDTSLILRITPLGNMSPGWPLAADRPHVLLGG